MNHRFCLIVRNARRPMRDGLGDHQPVVLHERHVRRLDRGVGAGDAHRDPDVGLRQRGRVVDPVADHGDDVALALQLGDRADLVCREHLGLEVEPEPSGDRSGDLTPIARQQEQSSNARARRSASSAAGTSGRSVSASAMSAEAARHTGHHATDLPVDGERGDPSAATSVRHVDARRAP